MDARASRFRGPRTGEFYSGVRDDLIAYAEAQFKLSRRQADGRTLQETLEKLALQDRKAQAELAALEKPELPEVAAGAWDAFLALSAHRGSNGFGPSALSWLDLDAWQRVTGGRLSALERKWVFELDALYLKDVSAEMKSRAQP